MKYLFIFLLSIAISFILTPLIRRLALRFRIVSNPRPDRWHSQPMPMLGSIPLFITSAFLISIFIPMQKPIIGFLICSAIIFFIGLVDDFLKFSPQIKLLGQIFVSCIAVMFGIVFGGLPESLFIFAIVLTISWITGIINSFNLLDNMDGLSCGIACICAFVLFILSSGARDLELIALIICGASLGFLPFNFNPAKIFMGDSGSMFLGFSISALSIMGSSQHISNLFAILLVPLLILGVPIFDTAFVMLLRGIKGKRISEGGKDHTSHHLVALGLSERKTVLLLYLFSAIFGFIALTYPKVDLIFFVILTFLATGILLYFGMFLAETGNNTQEEVDRIKKEKLKNNKVILNTIILHKRRIVEVITDFIFICSAYYLAYFLRFEGKVDDPNMLLLARSLPWIIPLKLIAFYYFGLYRGVWRYIGIHDLVSIFKAVSSSSAIIIIMLTFFARFQEYSRVVFIIDWLLLLLFVSGSRIFMRLLMEYFSSLGIRGRNIIIAGAGDKGEILLREIRRNKNFNYRPVGFIDDNPKKVGSQIHGLNVLGTKEDLSHLIKQFDIEKIFIAIPPKFKENINHIIEVCQTNRIEYQVIYGMLDFQ